MGEGVLRRVVGLDVLRKKDIAEVFGDLGWPRWKTSASLVGGT